MSRGDLRILLIDDDPEDRALARVVLQHELARLEIEEVTDAVAFAQACGRRDFELVIVEQRLAWAEGLAIVAALKEDWPEVPVIMFTRFGDQEVSVKAVRLGVESYLVKRSGNFLRLPLAVQSALEQARSRPRSSRRAGRLESLLTQARLGVFSATTDGRLVNASSAFLDLLGVERLEDAARLDLAPLISPGALDAALADAGPRGETMGREVELRRADGRPIWLHVMTTAVRDSEGRVRLDGLAEDVTERKRAEDEMARRAAELYRSNDELHRFTTLASHEIQEPVRMLERYARLLREDYGDKLDAEADEMIGFVADAAQRLQSLIEDLLALSRLESRDRPFEPADAEELLGRALLDLGAAIAESGATVTHSPLPILRVDPFQIVLLLQNLIGNAIKFRSDAPPRVHVSAARTDDQWVFSVHDNGIGIDPADADSIFEMFKRLRPEVPGSGIGLALCKRAVERHGGRIWVKSEPGQGSTFYFTIPATQEESR